MQKIVIAAVLWLLPISLYGQWLDFRTPGIPRTADGKPNMTAPAPRTPDGKPDLSGMWRSGPNTYRFNLVQSLEEEHSFFRPETTELFFKNARNMRRDDPFTNCLPPGFTEMFSATYRILQTPAILAMLFESHLGRYRQIYMDGRPLPEDPNPTWLGYSIGHWDGDTLVVETNGLNDRTWLDRAGHPHSEKLRVTEKYHRVDFGHMQYQITFDDSEMLQKPWTASVPLIYAADTDMLESVCNENPNRYENNHKITDPPGVPLSRAVLAKYTGKYEYSEGSKLVVGFVGASQTVDLVNGELFLNAVPLVPTSETAFDGTGSAVEFVLGKDGKVSRMILTEAGYQASYAPKR